MTVGFLLACLPDSSGPSHILRRVIRVRYPTFFGVFTVLEAFASSISQLKVVIRIYSNEGDMLEEVANRPTVAPTSVVPQCPTKPQWDRYNLLHTYYNYNLIVIITYMKQQKHNLQVVHSQPPCDGKHQLIEKKQIDPIS